MAGNPMCGGEGHTMHMCSLLADYFNKTSPEQYRELTENPQFRCENCGATAKSDDNLCNPIEL